ncbi:MAG TPA: flagellar hook-basal body complex protein FliE [Deltaproteobacteria bacterium]|nr:flagellar hook-basal body complex protein FliE [Deltaproteobacteria bacterium]
MKIDGLVTEHFLESIQKPQKSQSPFADVLKDSINKVGEIEREADKEAEKLARMETQDIHSTMIAIEKADITFQLMMQVRNKILNAYEEIMRMQV